MVAGCLRNAAAVARWLVQTLEAGGSVTVIAAGERWGTDPTRAATRLCQRTSANRQGFARDVDAAADLDASSVVPVLVDGAFETRTLIRCTARRSSFGDHMT